MYEFETFEMKPSLRTIFIQINNDETPLRYKLNLPKMVFRRCLEYKYNVHLDFYNEKNQKCYSPFFNVLLNGKICFGQEILNESIKDCANLFFSTSFEPPGNVSYAKSLDQYISIVSHLNNNYHSGVWDSVCKFYENWQNCGKLNFIEIGI